MKERNKELIKNTSLLMLGNIGSKMLSFILIPIYTSILTTSEYGIFDLLSTTESFLIPILTLDIGDAVFRYGIDEELNTNTVFNSGIFLWFSSVFFAIVLTLFVQNIFDKKYCLFVLLTFIFHSLYTFLINYSKGVDKLNLIAFGGIINTFTFGCLCVCLLVIWPLGLNGYMIAYIVGFVFPDIWILVGLRNKINIKIQFIDLKLLKKMLHYSIPLIFASISWWIISASDIYMITWFCGSSENGIYSMSYKIPNILVAVMTIFSQAWVVSAVKEDDNEFYKKIYRIYTSMLSIVGLILIGFSEIIGRILYSSDFYIAWKIAPLLIMAAIYQGLTGFLCDLLTSKKDAIGIAVSGLTGAFLNIILNIIFIQKFYAMGAAFATLISMLTVWGFLSIRLKKKYTINLNSIKDVLHIFLIFISIIAIQKSNTFGFIISGISIFVIIIINFSAVKSLVISIYNKIEGVN